MPDDYGSASAERPLGEPVEDPEFQKRWIEARRLSWDQVELAFRHGFDARERFAERPFPEVEDYLHESWDGMDPPVAWEQVADIVRSGYERYTGAGVGPSTEDVSDALRRFPIRTIGGSATGGIIGERPLLGAAEPVSDYEGEGGRPVGGETEPGDGATSR